MKDFEESKRTARTMEQIQIKTWHLVNARRDIFFPDSGTTFFNHLLSDKVARIHLTAEKNVRYGIELWSTELVNSVRE